MGVDVDYRNIDTLVVEIVDQAQPILLTRQNNFSGLKLIVKNNAKKHYLFEMAENTWDTISLNPDHIETGDFSTVQKISHGVHLLQLQDDFPWVGKREGYSYGATRKDIILVVDGVAQNCPISSYSTDSTMLNALYCTTDDELKTVSNITIIRDSSSTEKTFCFRFDGVNNLKINKITIITPNPKNMYADESVVFTNSVNILAEDITINGTYSRKSNYGYGIMMNNVWNSAFVRLKATADWGIFGTNNLSNTTLRNCDINRFDVHCYGRDAYIYNTKFSKLYNQFSSMYGTLLFENCRFTEFIPVLIETSYNAYTGFDVIFKNCTFEASPLRNYLISVGKIDNQVNPRPELSAKCWPNVQIQNMVVKVDKKVSKVVLFFPKGTAADKLELDYINKIDINGLRMVYSDTSNFADFVISNTPVKTKKTLRYSIKKLELIPSVSYMMRQNTRKYHYPGSLILDLGKSKKDMVTISDSRLNYNVNKNCDYNITYNNCQLGMVRNNPKSNGAKRYYNSCTLYLNNADDAKYYIDNHAVYDKCTFIPCNPKMYVWFYGKDNDVTMKNCTAKKVGSLLYKGRLDNSNLRKYTLKGAAK